MRREAHFHENVFFKGAWGSEFLFAMLEREWACPAVSSPASSDSLRRLGVEQIARWQHHRPDPRT